MDAYMCLIQHNLENVEVINTNYEEPTVKFKDGTKSSIYMMLNESDFLLSHLDLLKTRFNGLSLDLTIRFIEIEKLFLIWNEAWRYYYLY